MGALTMAMDAAPTRISVSFVLGISSPWMRTIGSARIGAAMTLTYVCGRGEPEMTGANAALIVSRLRRLQLKLKHSYDFESAKIGAGQSLLDLVNIGAVWLSLPDALP